MPIKKRPDDPNGLSDSDLATLRELADSRQLDAAIARRDDARRSERRERVKNAMVWIGAAAGLKGLLWEPITKIAAVVQSWLQAHIK